MKTFTYTQVKKHLAQILEMVKNREEIIVSKNKGKERVAVILPYKKYRKEGERLLGILKGKASFEIKSDFKMSDEEFLAFMIGNVKKE